MNKSTVLFLCTLFLVSCKSDPQELITQGIAQLKQQKFKDAVPFFNEAIDLDNKLDKAWNGKGIAYYNLGKNSQALNSFNQAIKITQKEYKYYYNRGNVKRTLDDPRGAFDDYSKALDLDSTHYDIYLNRALVMAQFEDIPKAIGDYNKAEKLNGGKDPNIYFYRGRANVKLEDFESAISDLQKCIEMKSDFGDAYYQLAIAQWKMNEEDTSLACQSAQKAKELHVKEADELINAICQ